MAGKRCKINYVLIKVLISRASLLRCGPMSEQAKTVTNKQERRAQWCSKLSVQAANTKAPLCVHRRASTLLSAHTACQTKRCPFKKPGGKSRALSKGSRRGLSEKPPNGSVSKGRRGGQSQKDAEGVRADTPAFHSRGSPLAPAPSQDIQRQGAREKGHRCRGSAPCCQSS